MSERERSVQGRAAGFTIGRAWFLLFSLMILAGAATFLVGISGAHSLRAWQAYLTNYVFWTGLACGTFLFSPLLTMTGARWGRPLKRIAEAPGAFLPAAFILFWVLYLGKEEIFPWIREPVPEKAVWLNAGFMFAREGIGILALAAVGMAILIHSVKGDLKMPLGPGDSGEAQRPQGHDVHFRAQGILSPIYGVLYGFILTLFAFDLIMSLDPHWYSTLFGAYFFTGSFYSGLAALVILAVIAVRRMGIGDIVSPKQFHDLGKLLLGFCLLTGDFFYAQFLVIWYGNIPEETRYVVLRVNQPPWEPLAWLVLVTAFGIPFAVLLSRRVKMKPIPMLVLSTLILLAMWLERFLLVAPSLWKGRAIPLGWMDLVITAGFFGLVALCTLGFLRRFPVLPVSDPLFQELLRTRRSGHEP
ncbi:MAG: hypothetical protein AB1512_21420 [Thermodesulfobacteriota bacterium]